jgi:hypothetical protein
VSDRIETEATIVTVADDASWKYSIEADIPAFDGDRSYRYLVWKKDQGPPPQIGSTVMATFAAYQRAKYYIERGDIEAGPVDGSEKDYQVSWNMIGSRPVGTPNGAAPGSSTGQTPSAPLPRSSDASGVPGVVYRPAPTPDERQAEAMAKFRRDQEGVNDRKAVSDILAMVEPGTYTREGLIIDAEILAGWYNLRLAARCESPPLVQAAQDAGAVVTEVVEKPDGPPPLKNKAELSEWVTAQGYSKEAISGALQDAGYASSGAYLENADNTVQGLAALLHDKLNW